MSNACVHPERIRAIPIPEDIEALCL